MCRSGSNFWILTEERPKNSVVKTILEKYCGEEIKGELAIKPITANGKFTFDYAVENISIERIGTITIRIVSGLSSFMDYILIKQPEPPVNHALENVVMMVEETKTSDAESRNTGIGQRAMKFAFAEYFCPEVPKYMLYNEEATAQKDKLSDTNIFGTRMLLAQGVKFIGKDISKIAAFETIDELVNFKSLMRKPPESNVPIVITKTDNRICVSGRLSKPANAGNIAYDPSEGTLACIAATLRKLGWAGEIVFTKHGVSQEYVNKNHSNKFLSICKILNAKLEGLTMPSAIELPQHYWKYSNTSEKIASILLHISAQYCGIHGIYENHAGCERGYYKRDNGALVALPKKDMYGVNLYLPDVVLDNEKDKEIYLIEGKRLATLSQGLTEIENYDSIENEFIKIDYPEHAISRWITVFGGQSTKLPHAKVLLYVADDGTIMIAPNAPQAVKDCFKKLGFAF